MSDKKTVTVVQHNHFDPIWRRCWDRTFDYRGRRFRSYADVEEHVINIWLESAKRGATFSEGQAVVFRKYLERHPERLEEMRDLVKGGVIELTGAGETVADTNMPSGESLLRNLVMGQRWFEDTFGVIPHIGWIEDAFGQSAQIPQLFRGVECDMVIGLCYARVFGLYWRGLDGSMIFMGESDFTCYAGFCTKISPCPECGGSGCAKCDSTGLSEESRIQEDDLWGAFRSTKYLAFPSTRVTIGGEEAIPNPRLPEILEQANRERDDVEFRFGGFQHVAEDLAGKLAKLDEPDEPVSDEVEGNPASTGCYVTRIKIKQSFRRVENLVNTAERWATIAHLLGADYPADCLTEAWRSILFVAFHDAITSTHLDSAYHELMDMMEDAEHEADHVMTDALDAIEQQIASDPDREYLMVYNSESWERDEPVSVTLCDTAGCPALKDPKGREIEVLDAVQEGANVTVTFRAPNVPPLGYAAVEIIEDARRIDSGEVTDGPGIVENEFYRINVTDRGIDSIFDKRTNVEVLDTSRYLCNELILEEDVGHPWGTMQPPSFAVALSKHTTGVKIRRSSGLTEVTLTGQYKGDDANVKLLTWRQRMRLYAGFDRIDFRTEIDWDTAQRRIRIAFPTAIKTDEMVYSIPYGALKRARYEPDMTKMPSTNGDWPAVNWVDAFDEVKGGGVAVINTGTPSHKIEDGIIYVSVLRSPTDSWCLNEPEYYDCPDFDGARDAGTHEFDYSLIPHAGDYRAAAIDRRARECNCPLIMRPLSCSGPGNLGLRHAFMRIDAPSNVVVTALKKADRDDSIIVRLAETGGMPAEASVEIEGAGKNISTVNFLERYARKVGPKVTLGPFRVVTVKLGD